MNRRTVVLLAGALAVLALGGGVVHAGGLSDDLNQYLDDMGNGANLSAPNVYKGQSRTFMNGGRLFVRTPSRTIRPVTISRPSISAGCGGIDAYSGGISHIDADEFLDTLESAVSNAKGYLFLIALRSISPQVANSIEKVYSWIQKINQWNENSCRLGAQMAHSIASREWQSEEDSVCVTQRMESSDDSYQEAQVACGAGGGSTPENTLDDEEAQEQHFINGNLVWMVMHNNEMFEGEDNREMREVMMSLTGTVTRSVENRETKTHISQLVLSDQLLDAMLEGGEADVMRCAGEWHEINDPFGCIEVADDATVSIPDDEALFHRMRNAMHNVYLNIRHREDPGTDDLEFVTTTGFPVNKVLTIAAAMGGSVGPQLVDRYAEVAAVQMLDSYLSQLLDAIEAETGAETRLGTKNAMFMRNSARIVREKMRDKVRQVRQGFQTGMQMAKEMKHYENILVSVIPERLGNSARWGASF